MGETELNNQPQLLPLIVNCLTIWSNGNLFDTSKACCFYDEYRGVRQADHQDDGRPSELCWTSRKRYKGEEGKRHADTAARPCPAGMRRRRNWRRQRHRGPPGHAAQHDPPDAQQSGGGKVSASCALQGLPARSQADPLGMRALEQRPLVAMARPHIEALARRTGDTVHLGVLEDAEVFYLDKISGTRGLEMRSRVGLRMPIACTGLGKGLMLGLPRDQWRALRTRPRVQRQVAGPSAAGALAGVRTAAGELCRAGLVVRPGRKRDRHPLRRRPRARCPQSGGGGDQRRQRRTLYAG